ncbi:MAG TPA: TonB-dependent receptor, partial [Caulobacteraceae bacterium]|nr:TonB-dependent receptor [Caulobacteraceae bacterium]
MAAPATQPTPAGDAITSYPPSFFTRLRPNTALDMVNALPGFTLDTGGGGRGFAGAAGNVLIDGERPATKNDALDQLLQRISASSVARIDVIRGGAPGIDMQGKTVIANVIRKADNGLKLTTAWQETALYNGKFDYDLRLEGSKRSGDTLFEGGMLVGNNADDGTGDGPRTITDAAGVVTRSGLEHFFGEQGIDKFTAAVETPVLGGKVRVEGSYVHSPYVS